MTNNAEVGIKVGESLIIRVTDPDTGAEAQMTLTADWVVATETPPGPEPEPPADGAATFLAPLEATVSSLETGEVVQVTAWGGSEYGYAYTYTLVTAPPGLSIDADTGRIRLDSALSVGDKKFSVRATNREDTSKSADFDFTLHVLEGITSGKPTASQILHKTYDPHSGTWGKAARTDWTSVFNKLAAAIIADQEAAGEEKLRATIPLRRGQVYQYTNNRWPEGIQYLEISDTGNGALPVLQCTRSDPGQTNPYDNGPLNVGRCGSINHQEGIKARCATIASAAMGSTQLTLLDAGDAAKIKPGRWHQVMGWCIQMGGFPPNEQWTEFVKVLSVEGSTVTLDRPLRHGYDQTWWEDPMDDQSLGVARLVPFDTGGAGGYIPADPRAFIRCRFVNLDMQANPNAGVGPPTGIVLAGCGIDFSFEGCRLPNNQFSSMKHVVFRKCVATMAWEPDKMSETMVLDDCTTVGYAIGGGTGFDYALFRNSHLGIIQISPRQLRSIGCHHDGTGDGGASYDGLSYGPPVVIPYNGAIGAWDFGSAGACQFTKGNHNQWIWGVGSEPDTSLTLGTDATWNGNQLQIPRAFANFERWLMYSPPGTILSPQAQPPYTTNWGYVASASSPGDGSALWLNVVWVDGTKPSSGRLCLKRPLQLYFAEGNSFTAGTSWASPAFARQTAPGKPENWDFPPGYPPEFMG